MGFFTILPILKELSQGNFYSLEKFYVFPANSGIHISDTVSSSKKPCDIQHISEAENWIKRAIETNQKYSMMWNLAQDYALYAELFKRKGDLSKAKQNLSKAIEIFTECGADGWVEKYEKELNTL